MNEHRRRFLTGCGLVLAGAAGSRLLPGLELLSTAAEQDEPGVEARLRELKIELPAPTRSKNTLAMSVRVGDLLYVSGHGPSGVVGKVGRDLDVKQGQEAARNVGLRVLSTVKDALGSLDKVVRLVKTLGMVNATADFKDQPAVVNGFSNLMVEVFGEQKGKGTRSAVGMGSLPGGIPIEVETVWQVKG
ncbi:MAG: RidA family protein [Gemmataceae bacterium]